MNVFVNQICATKKWDLFHHLIKGNLKCTYHGLHTSIDYPWLWIFFAKHKLFINFRWSSLIDNTKKKKRRRLENSHDETHMWYICCRFKELQQIIISIFDNFIIWIKVNNVLLCNKAYDVLNLFSKHYFEFIVYLLHKKYNL